MRNFRRLQVLDRLADERDRHPLDFSNANHYHYISVLRSMTVATTGIFRPAEPWEIEMNAMLVGADRLGSIPDRLAAFGITITRHVSGRNAMDQRRLPALPKNIDLLILFTDFLGHNVMKSFRSQAQADGVRVVACRRSASCLAEELERRLAPADACQTCPRHSTRG